MLLVENPTDFHDFPTFFQKFLQNSKIQSLCLRPDEKIFQKVLFFWEKSGFENRSARRFSRNSRFQQAVQGRRIGIADFFQVATIEHRKGFSGKIRNPENPVMPGK